MYNTQCWLDGAGIDYDEDDDVGEKNQTQIHQEHTPTR